MVCRVQPFQGTLLQQALRRDVEQIQIPAVHRRFHRPHLLKDPVWSSDRPPAPRTDEAHPPDPSSTQSEATPRRPPRHASGPAPGNTTICPPPVGIRTMASLPASRSSITSSWRKRKEECPKTVRRRRRGSSVDRRSSIACFR